MHLPNCEYYAPTALSDALELLHREGDAAVPLAGGTDLLVLMKEGKLKPKALLTLRNIAELHVVRMHNGSCTAGAAATITALARSPLPLSNPAFADLAQRMATRQIRNRASIGGNLCTAAACADCPPVLLINDARVKLASATGERELPLVEFLSGPRMTLRRTDELLHSLTFRRENRGSAYVKFGVRNAATIAIVGVAAALEINADRITKLKLACTAASPVPVVIDEAACGLAGAPAGEDAWRQAAESLQAALAPISDLRGSAEYRLQLATVAAVRALRLACERWQGVADA